MTYNKLVRIANRVQQVHDMWTTKPESNEIRRIISAEFPPSVKELDDFYNLLIDITSLVNNHINKLRAKANIAGLPVELRWKKSDFIRAMLIEHFKDICND